MVLVEPKQDRGRETETRQRDTTRVPRTSVSLKVIYLRYESAVRINDEKDGGLRERLNTPTVKFKSPFGSRRLSSGGVPIHGDWISRLVYARITLLDLPPPLSGVRFVYNRTGVRYSPYVFTRIRLTCTTLAAKFGDFDFRTFH